MFSAEIKNQAFTEFLNGKSLREISLLPAMPCSRTLEKWSSDDNWNSKRSIQNASVMEKIIQEACPEKVEELKSLDSKRIGVAMTALAQLQALIEGKIKKNDLPISENQLIKIICRLTK